MIEIKTIEGGQNDLLLKECQHKKNRHNFFIFRRLDLALRPSTAKAGTEVRINPYVYFEF